MNDEIVMSSDAIALKEIASGEGSDFIPATDGGLGSSEFKRIVIPHRFGNDRLAFRVMCRIPSSPIYSEWFVAPLTLIDGGVVPSLDINHLYIEAVQQGVSLPAREFFYSYRIFVP